MKRYGKKQVRMKNSLNFHQFPNIILYKNWFKTLKIELDTNSKRSCLIIEPGIFEITINNISFWVFSFIGINSNRIRSTTFICKQSNTRWIICNHSWCLVPPIRRQINTRILMHCIQSNSLSFYFQTQKARFI